MFFTFCLKNGNNRRSKSYLESYNLLLETQLQPQIESKLENIEDKAKMESGNFSLDTNETLKAINLCTKELSARREVLGARKLSKWATMWSRCNSSCGPGISTRVKGCPVNPRFERRLCFQKHCSHVWFF